MSVLIKGMKMPNVCDECWALDESGDYPMCRITGETRGYNFRVREKRMDRCPLIELPDNVDLIDRAAALEEIESFYPPKVRGESEAEEINRVGWECAINCIEVYLRTVKPVIPAERSEE